MIQDLSNTAFLFSYINTSWTIGADAGSQFICRLLKELEDHHIKAAVPRLIPETMKSMQPRCLMNLNSTYVTKAELNLPKGADPVLWQPRDNYFNNIKFAGQGRLDTWNF